MKLIVLLTLIAFSYGEKLDRIYLPPNAQISSGSDGQLHTPIPGPVTISDSADLQRQIAEIIATAAIDNKAVDSNLQTSNDIVRIGDSGNLLLKNANAGEYEEVKYPGAYYQAIQQNPERAQAALERHAAILRHDYHNDGDSYAYAYETENGIYGEENGVATNGVAAHGVYSYVGDDGIHYNVRYTADENGFQPQGDHLPTPPPIPEEILKSLEQNSRDEAAGIYDDGSYDERRYGGGDVKQDLGIINVGVNHPIVVAPTINDDAVVITNSALLPTFSRAGYDTKSVFDDQSDLAPIVNSLVQEVTPSTFNKGYLPPNQAVLEGSSSKNNVFGSRNHQPDYNGENGYQY